ncbi:MAG: DUF2939 domain-containing protein [Hyphomicrobiaceae bacterium]
MRRVLLLAFAVVLGLLGFYVAWPAWTGHQIRQAIESNDAAALAERIDFDRVRARAKPLIAQQMQRSLDQLQKSGGALGAVIAEQLKASFGEKLANAAIDATLTPENVMRFARQGKDIGRILKDIAREGAEKGSVPASPPPGAAGGGVPPPSQETPPRHKLTHENIKSYRITGPLSIEVGAAHDPRATTPDVIAELAFTDGTWKVVGLVPQL